MRKIVFALLLLLCNVVYAEDVIQVVPFVTKPGSTSDDAASFTIAMNNGSNSIWAYQFDIKLPNGMTFDTAEDPFELSGDRYPTTGRGANKKPKHMLSYDIENQTDGWCRVVVSTTDADRITGESGEIITAYYVTDNSMAPGVYPIQVKGTVLSISGSEKIKPEESTSYVVISSDGTTNLLESLTDVDLSALTGYIPSFVVEQLNADIASNANLRSLNLSGTTYENLGAELQVPNNDDLLWYTSDKAALNRTFAAEKWSTLCLPFTLQASALSGTPTIKVMESYDDSDASITLSDATTLEKGKPYMVRCASETKLINNVSISDPEPVGNEPGSVNSGKLTMKGTYQGTTVSSTAAKTYYGFSNDKFVGVNVGGSGRVKPFRAYLEYEGAAGTRSIGLGDDNGTTAIEKIADDGEADSPLYNLQGMRIEGTPRAKGVYLRNGKKQIIK